MSLFHGIWRRRVSLLTVGALHADERERTLVHIEHCESCRADQAALAATLDLMASDPVHDTALPISFEALRTRVEARIDQAERQVAARGRLRSQPSRPLRFAFGSLAAAVAVVLTLFVLPQNPRPVPTPIEPTITNVPEQMLRRMEGRLARQQAARYLGDAQDVLVTVTAARQDCDRKTDRVDVTAEARRSRELLARRALVVQMDRPEVLNARPVLEDVEQVLREVASLKACARARDVAEIHERVEQRRLMMKIDLLRRELMG